jgi:hypothetical protein
MSRNGEEENKGTKNRGEGYEGREAEDKETRLPGYEGRKTGNGGDGSPVPIRELGRRCRVGRLKSSDPYARAELARCGKDASKIDHTSERDAVRISGNTLLVNI